MPTRNLLRKKQEENPLLGEWRIYAALKQLGISVPPRTCGRIMAENRRLYGIQPPPKEPHKPKPHPFRATIRHERWCVDIRYIEKHRIPEISGSSGENPRGKSETENISDFAWLFWKRSVSVLANCKQHLYTKIGEYLEKNHCQHAGNT